MCLYFLHHDKQYYFNALKRNKGGRSLKCDRSFFTFLGMIVAIGADLITQIGCFTIYRSVKQS
jgi:hypothetical protein